MMQEWDVLPDAKRRALRALEKAGLIAIERRGKRSPRVTLVVQNSRNSGLEIQNETYGAVRSGRYRCAVR
jgi:hypothetical protein